MIIIPPNTVDYRVSTTNSYLRQPRYSAYFTYSSVQSGMKELNFCFSPSRTQNKYNYSVQ